MKSRNIRRAEPVSAIPISVIQILAIIGAILALTACAPAQSAAPESNAAGGAAAITELEQDAAEGDEESQFKLALVHDLGIDVPENNTEAIRWYTMAAQSGHAKAQFNLAVMYDQGEDGVPENNREAAKWYEAAADQGHEGAQFNVALMYDQGEPGVAEDNVKAVKWYEMSGAGISIKVLSANFPETFIP